MEMTRESAKHLKGSMIMILIMILEILMIVRILHALFLVGRIILILGDAELGVLIARKVVGDIIYVLYFVEEFI